MTHPPAHSGAPALDDAWGLLLFTLLMTTAGVALGHGELSGGLLAGAHACLPGSVDPLFRTRHGRVVEKRAPDDLPSWQALADSFQFKLASENEIRHRKAPAQEELPIFGK